MSAEISSMVEPEHPDRRRGGKPSPTTIGGLQAAAVYARFYSDPVSCMVRIARDHGACVRILHPVRAASAPSTYLLVGADWNKAVLTDAQAFRPSGLWPVGGPEGSAVQQLRKNFLVQSGAEHAQFSRVAAPAFNRARVGDGYPEMVSVAREEVSSWPTGHSIDCARLSRRLMQRLAFAGLFAERRCDHALALGEKLDDFHLDQWSRSAQLFPLDWPGLRYRNLLRKADGLRADLLQWRHAPSGGSDRHNLRACFETAEDPAGAPVSDIEKAAQLAGLLVASYETASATLAWILMFMALFPDYLDPLRQEADRLFADGGTAPQIEDTSLLAGFVDETLRVSPPVPFLGFRALQTTEILGLEIEKGATVFISVLLTQRDPVLFQDPWSFRPERWRTISPNTYEFPAFSGGARRCPGFRFATNNLRHALAAIVSSFDIAADEKARFDYQYAAVMRPKGALPLTLSPRGAETARKSRPPLRGNVGILFDDNQGRLSA